MPTLDLSRLDASEEARVSVEEASFERFDRLAFATRAVELVRPAGMTVAICEARSRLRVEAGPAWGGGPNAAWAIVRVPRTASREAIALAVSRLGIPVRTRAVAAAGTAAGPWALDVLLARAAERTA